MVRVKKKKKREILIKILLLELHGAIISLIGNSQDYKHNFEINFNGNPISENIINFIKIIFKFSNIYSHFWIRLNS